MLLDASTSGYPGGEPLPELYRAVATARSARHTTYLAPTLTPAGVVTAVPVTGGYPALVPLDAHYRAAAVGQVGLATLADIAFNHEPTPCPSPQAWWRPRVTVTG